MIIYLHIVAAFLPQQQNWVAVQIQRASLVAQWYRLLLPVQGTQVLSSSQEDPVEEGVAPHTSVLAWEIPWAEELGELQSIGS